MDQDIKKSIRAQLTEWEYKSREEMMSHMPYDNEIAFYRSVKEGDIKEAHRLFEPLNVEGLGILSKDSMRNLKYHLIITVALITRYCIEGGLDMETAYNLSDVYIQRIDVCRTADELNDIHRELVDDYVTRMSHLAGKNRYSASIMISIDYIYNHLHKQISIGDLSEACGVSKSHLSREFHKEVGETITDYILHKRIEAAKNLLEFTDHLISDIANSLAFSSESYFIECFKRECGMTPYTYRKQNFRSSNFDLNKNA